jgi:hypothetical protein
LDLFIDRGILYIEYDNVSNVSELLNFDDQWYVSPDPAINLWLLIRGNIIVNGLMIGRQTLSASPNQIEPYPHKVYIQGKISTLNTPFPPTNARIEFIKDLLPNFDYTAWINLQNVFVRVCWLNGVGTDGSSCSDQSRISTVPLVIIDGKYPSRLLDN